MDDLQSKLALINSLRKPAQADPTDENVDPAPLNMDDAEEPASDPDAVPVDDTPSSASNAPASPDQPMSHEDALASVMQKAQASATPVSRDLPDVPQQGQLKPELQDDAYKNALNEEKKFKALAALGRGTNMIGAGGVIAAGGKPINTDTAYKGIEDLGAFDREAIEKRRKGAKDELDYSKDRLETGNLFEDDTQMRDPNSMISQVYREAVKKAGMQVPDNASAKSLEKVLGASSKLFRSQIIHNISRKIVDPKTGEIREQLINPQTGEVVKDLGQAGFANQVRTDAFGNVIQVSPSAPLGATPAIVKSSSRQAIPTDADTRDAAVKSFRPDKDQVKGITEERKFMDKVNKEATNRLEAANNIATLLKDPNKLTAGTVAFQMARLSGSNSQLSDSERAVFASLPDIVGKTQQVLQAKINGTITPELLNEYKKIVNQYSAAAKTAIDGRANQSAQTLEANYSVPSEYSMPQLVPSLVKQNKPLKLEGETSAPKVVKLPKKFTPGQVLRIKGVRHTVNEDGMTATRME